MQIQPDYIQWFSFARQLEQGLSSFLSIFGLTISIVIIFNVLQQCGYHGHSIQVLGHLEIPEPLECHAHQTCNHLTVNNDQCPTHQRTRSRERCPGLNTGCNKNSTLYMSWICFCKIWFCLICLGYVFVICGKF